MNNSIGISEIIIVYELFNREYDNALLLKAFFETKGFVVSIIYRYDLIDLPYSESPKIMFIPNCYNTQNMEWYYHLANGRNYYLIDLQYEQSLSNDKKNIDFHLPKGKAANIVHLCWGEQYRNILVEHGINPENAYVSGALHLDFLRPQFNTFWESRNRLAEEHKIDTNKKWNLYISSFSVADNELSKVGVKLQLGNEYAEYFAEFSSKSRKKTIEWFRIALKRDDDNIFIYRKHPAEVVNQDLRELSILYPDRFFLIDSYNIKQWIVVSDRILTWYSTSVVECYAAGKSFYILRPVRIKHQYDVQMYEGGHFVETMEEFGRILDSGDRKDYPINTELISNAYKLDGELAVNCVGRLVEVGFKYNYFEDKTRFKKTRKEIVNREHNRFKFIMKKVYKKLYCLGIFKIKSQRLRSRFAIDEWERVLPEDEIRIKLNKLRDILSD